MNQFTWCAQVRFNVSSRRILFGRIEANNGGEAEEKLVKELQAQEYGIERYCLHGFRKAESFQLDVLP